VINDRYTASLAAAAADAAADVDAGSDDELGGAFDQDAAGGSGDVDYMFDQDDADQAAAADMDLEQSMMYDELEGDEDGSDDGTGGWSALQHREASNKPQPRSAAAVGVRGRGRPKSRPEAAASTSVVVGLFLDPKAPVAARALWPNLLVTVQQPPSSITPQQVLSSWNRARAEQVERGTHIAAAAQQLYHEQAKTLVPIQTPEHLQTVLSQKTRGGTLYHTLWLQPVSGAGAAAAAAAGTAGAAAAGRGAPGSLSAKQDAAAALMARPIRYSADQGATKQQLQQQLTAKFRAVWQHSFQQENALSVCANYTATHLSNNTYHYGDAHAAILKLPEDIIQTIRTKLRSPPFTDSLAQEVRCPCCKVLLVAEVCLLLRLLCCC
jgi:hypothetical protein